MFQLTGGSQRAVASHPRPFTAVRVPVPTSHRGGVSTDPRLPLVPSRNNSSGISGAAAAASSAVTIKAELSPSVLNPSLTSSSNARLRGDPHQPKQTVHPLKGHWAKQRQNGRLHTSCMASTAGAGPVNIGDLQLDVPEIDGDVRSLQVEMGAIFNDAGLATTYGRKREALQALETGVVLVDQSHWGRLRVAGDDRLALLHNQSTADFHRLQPGESTDTVFVTSTARCMDLATALVLPSSVLVLLDSREGKDALAARLDKVIFRGDKVTVQDISARTAQFALLGPEAELVLRELAADALSGVLSGPRGRHVLVGFRGKPAFVAAMSSLGPSVPGYTFVADEAVAGDLFAAFAAKGAIPMGTDEWEAARIIAGRPIRGSELTDAFNPLEAGLYGAVSLNKGCYIGQETLAKVHLRDGVNRQLWGLRLSGPTSPGAEITSEMSKIGVVTSTCQDTDGEWVGLGYLRSRLEGMQIELEGVRVAVAGAPATVTAIPFASRKFSAEAESPAVRTAAADAEDDSSIAGRLDEAKRKKAAAQAEKQAATEAKLKAMQERLAAWQAAQQQQQS